MFTEYASNQIEKSDQIKLFKQISQKSLAILNKLNSFEFNGLHRLLDENNMSQFLCPLEWCHRIQFWVHSSTHNDGLLSIN